MSSVEVYGLKISLDNSRLRELSDYAGLDCPEIELYGESGFLRNAYNPIHTVKQLFLKKIILSPWLCLSSICAGETPPTQSEIKTKLAESLVYRLCYYNTQTANPLRALMKCPPFLLILSMLPVFSSSVSAVIAVLILSIGFAITYLQISALDNKQKTVLDDGPDWKKVFQVD